MYAKCTTMSTFLKIGYILKKLKNCVHWLCKFFFTFLKIVYVEYTELYIFFEKLCTLNYQNNVNSAKRVSV